MSDKTISVIIPVYNVLPYLKRCLDSVEGQSHEDLQIIAVDDGSTDGGGDFLDEYAKTHARFKVIHRANGGLSAARNTGIEEAKGEYIAFVDSDDFIHPRMYETLFKILSDTDADMAVSNFKRINETELENFSFPEITAGAVKSVSFSNRSDIFLQLKERDIQTTVAWTKLYKHSLFTDVRFPEGRLHEDAAIIHEILWKCEKVSFCEAEFYYYVQRAGGIMHELAESKKGMTDGIKAYEDRLRFFKEKNDTALFNETLELMYGNMLYKFAVLSKNSYTDDCDWLSGEVKRLLGYTDNGACDADSDKNDADISEAKKLLLSDIKLLAYEPKKYYDIMKKRERVYRLKGSIKKLLRL